MLPGTFIYCAFLREQQEQILSFFFPHAYRWQIGYKKALSVEDPKLTSISIS